MEAKQKEFALYDFMSMIQQSWTWERFTDEERKKFRECVEFACEQNMLLGTYKERWKILQLQYHTFLQAIGYEPFGWRDEEVNDNENGND